MLQVYNELYFMSHLTVQLIEIAQVSFAFPNLSSSFSFSFHFLKTVDYFLKTVYYLWFFNYDYVMLLWESCKEYICIRICISLSLQLYASTFFPCNIIRTREYYWFIPVSSYMHPWRFMYVHLLLLLHVYAVSFKWFTTVLDCSIICSNLYLNTINYCLILTHQIHLEFSNGHILSNIHKTTL